MKDSQAVPRLRESLQGGLQSYGERCVVRAAVGDERVEARAGLSRSSAPGAAEPMERSQQPLCRSDSSGPIAYLELPSLSVD